MPNEVKPELTHAALGLRVHSGWAAIIAVSGGLDSPVLLHRGRFEFADPAIAGSKQPYHAAKTMELGQAEKALQQCRERSTSLATKALGDCVHDLERTSVKVCACGVLLGSGRPLGALPAILASHALIHTAEGEFFRSAVIDACRHHGLKVVAVKERELRDRCHEELHLSQPALDDHVSVIGKATGPPWREDEKLATLVAWLALSAIGTSK